MTIVRSASIKSGLKRLTESLFNSFLSSHPGHLIPIMSQNLYSLFHMILRSNANYRELSDCLRWQLTKGLALCTLPDSLPQAFRDKDMLRSIE